jgi:hypothetical protein
VIEKKRLGVPTRIVDGLRYEKRVGDRDAR